MSYHYKKDGSLDMRYSSSKAAVSSGYGGSSSRSGGSSSGYGGSSSGYGGSSSYGSQSSYGSSSYSSPASGSSASSNLHYKKDGSLDMRYSSSKTVVAQQAPSSGYGVSYPSPSYGSSYSSPVSNPYSSPVANPYVSNDLHYKKDGSLDMRYASSKTAVGQGSSASDSVPLSDSLHYKKDGSLDMRYASSKEVAGLASCIKALQVVGPGSELHLKKDGSLDMRFRSSKGIGSSGKGLFNIPDSVPTKSDGTPDMRKKEAKDFVRQQAGIFANQGFLPSWVPKKKDGTIDASKAIGRAFMQATPPVSAHAQPTATKSREAYWRERAMDEIFQEILREERLEPQPLPPPAPLIFPQQSVSMCSASSSVSRNMSIPENVVKLDYKSLVFESDSAGTLGKGAFGIVRKATWNGMKVAVKVLHLTQLNRKEKADFEKEICILAALGKHPNLVFLHGYCTDPPCIVMELVERGSLSHLLHYCDDRDVEAKMTDGRVKKRLLYGTADGMLQLHAEKIVHGDLKPQNVLVTNDYTAKVTDFGLSTLRGKTSSSIRSHDDDDEPQGGAVGGTSGYMAPELLDSISPPDFPIDVYSFGILLNEVVAEEEPYSDQYANFAARGPFGAANYAKLGGRPTINKALTPPPVENLIRQCWSPDPARRPTFKNVLATIQDAMFIIPDSVNPPR